MCEVVNPGRAGSAEDMMAKMIGWEAKVVELEMEE